MTNFIYNHRFLLRRLSQVSILLLYVGANAWGWTVLNGNLSSSLLLGIVPLSDPYALLQMMIAGALIAFDIALGATIVLVFYWLVGGRSFCSWVCPVNMITDFAHWLRRKIHVDEVEKQYRISRNVRYWVIAISLVISFAMGIAAFEFISPISMVHRGIVFGLGFGWAAMVVIFLFDLFILKHGWCGHLCPLGAMYSIVGKYSLVRVNHDHEKCTNCMECKVVCPENHVLHMVHKRSEQVLSGACTNCGRCLEICSEDAFEFSIRNFINNDKES
jgi:ferredoxin-type protein NapH